MKVEPSGVVMWGRCAIPTDRCTAAGDEGGPVTAVWTSATHQQIDVCGACLADMRRRGDWKIEGTGAATYERQA